MRTIQKPSKTTVTRGLATGLFLFVLANCTSTQHTSSDSSFRRAAVDVPEHFVIGEPEGEAVTEPSGGLQCHNPMVDPRDGTRIRLVRSSDGGGDYEVPPGRYGVGEGEVLRLECGTGSVVGVFRQR